MLGLFLARLLALSAIAITPLLASLITSSSQIGSPQTVVDFSQFAGPVPTIVTTTPIPVGAGVTLRSTNPAGSYLGSGPYGFNDNGTWGPSLTLAGLNVDLFGGDKYAMTFTFAKPVSAVGGLIDYASYYGSGFSDTVLMVFAADGSILETEDISTYATAKKLDLSQGGLFFGISQPKADIAAFSLSNSAVAIRDLTFSGGSGSVPEPAAISLLALGAALLFRLRRGQRHRRQPF
jgi:hypothetical protein